MGRATFWAIFSQTHLVTLVTDELNSLTRANAAKPQKLLGAQASETNR
jgi:hypothetical protein